jgi:two-component system nitrogen regulation sensor histidine kinase GlnL
MPEPSLEKAILDSLTVPLLVADREGRVRYGNPAAGSFWRQPAHRLAGYTLARLFGQDDAVTQSVLRAIEEEASFTIEGHRLAQGEGQPPLLLRVQIDPLSPPDGPTQLALVLFWDLTRSEQLAAGTRETQLLDSIGLMVRRLAHELQNPLSGLKGATQLLARRLADHPELVEYPDVILKELERLQRLAKSLLAYGAEPPLAPVPFNLHALLDEVIWFETNSGAPVRFARDYDPSLPEVQADRDRLHQVFLNLIRNAVDASPPGGTVSLRTAMQGPWGPAEFLPSPGRTYFRIDVEDAGPGVPESELERLFTPFFTTKRAGTGLGLAISHQIVRAHEGLLRYRPGRQGGAVFTVFLPLLEGTPPP